MANVYHPTLVTQIGEEPNISWTATNHTFDRLPTIEGKIRTVKELKHISNPASGDLRDSTFSLICTGFNIPELEQINGIELRITAQRNGRIADEIIQLTYQNSAIGRNNFNYETDEEGRLTLLNDTVYGNSVDMWGADLTPEMLQDPSFGVIIKFASHPYYPHSSGMQINLVALTIH